MTREEQTRRFGYVVPDCHLAQQARKDARRQIAARFYTISLGVLMGCLLGAAMFAGAVIGG